MYLLVFVTLVIGLVGIYSQIITVQTARMAAGQTSLAQTMHDWHSAAVSMAASVLKSPYSPDNNGCSLTDVTFSGPSGKCPNAICGSDGVVTTSAGTRGRITTDGVTCNADVDLSEGYKAKFYQFHSILYLTTAGRFVLTWLPPPMIGPTNPAPGYVALPSSSRVLYQTSLTVSDVMQQFRNVGRANTFGAVKDNKLNIGSVTFAGVTQSLEYAVPSYVPTGSIGIISSADGY